MSCGLLDSVGRRTDRRALVHRMARGHRDSVCAGQSRRIRRRIGYLTASLRQWRPARPVVSGSALADTTLRGTLTQNGVTPARIAKNTDALLVLAARAARMPGRLSVDHGPGVSGSGASDQPAA